MSRPCSWLALLLTLGPATPAYDFRDLFDGKSLDGWVVEGPITIRLNGQKVLEPDQSELADVKSRLAGAPAPRDEPRKGYVALQSHSGRVEFRKVQIREK
jgi:Domain of Unknown Function (DUF1080)